MKFKDKFTEIKNFNSIKNKEMFNSEILEKINENERFGHNFKTEIFEKIESKNNFKNIKEFIENSENKGNILSIGLCLKCRYFLCMKSLTNKEQLFMKLYNKSEEIINIKMDMINYLSSMQDFINVEYLLFNSIHSLCLGFIDKPKIYEKSLFTKTYGKKYKKLAEIVDYFENKKNLTFEDKRIYNLLSKQVKNFILEYK